jgi:replicative DNA helicase
MTFDELGQDEQLVLAALLESPDANRWELDGLEADLFSRPLHRQIAEALIHVRERAVRLHWKRVRVELRGRGKSAAASLVEPLVRALGTHAGLTQAMSNLHRTRAARKSGRAA